MIVEPRKKIDDVMGAILGRALLGGTFGDVASATLRERARRVLIRDSNPG
jgi:hypothetical protein